MPEYLSSPSSTFLRHYARNSLILGALLSAGVCCFAAPAPEPGHAAFSLKASSELQIPQLETAEPHSSNLPVNEAPVHFEAPLVQRMYSTAPAPLTPATSEVAADILRLRASPEVRLYHPEVVAQPVTMRVTSEPPALAQESLVSAVQSTGAAPLASTTRFDRLAAKYGRVSDATAELLANSLSFVGVPYKRGGSTSSTGFDCSGLVRAVYARAVGLVLPQVAKDQAKAGDVITKQSDLRPGDLVFFNTMKRAFSHVGIYMGNGEFIHAPKPGAEVKVTDMKKNYWQERFEGGRRFIKADTQQLKAGEVSR